MFLYNRHLHTLPESSDTGKVPFQMCICHPLYREYLPHEHEYTGDFPSYLLRYVVFFLSFFHRHIRDFLRNTLFSRSANRSVRNLVLPSCLFSCYFDKMLHHFIPYAIISCPAIKTPYRIMRRIVMWQHALLTACLYNIQHCFYQ